METEIKQKMKANMMKTNMTKKIPQQAQQPTGEAQDKGAKRNNNFQDITSPTKRHRRSVETRTSSPMNRVSETG